jgi:CubicO group peptidase (beta-lactamase class C family)
VNTSTATESALEGAWSILRGGIAESAFPGAVVAITLRGELVATRAFGHFTYDPQSPEVHPDTLFDLASLTKPLAAGSAAMLLYDRGLLDLDAPVASVFPAFGADGERGGVTVRHLLAHSSGLPAYERLFLGAKSKEEIVAAACRLPLQASPGERTEYSDIGFLLLGEILERLSGEPLDSFSAREIFGPLAMSRTGFRPPRELRSLIPPTENDRAFRHRIIQGEVQDENAYVMGGVSAHAGLFAPATDVARLAECMLPGGRPIIRSETVRLFTSPQSVRTGYARALAWDRVSQPSQSGRYFSNSAFGHLGYTGTSLWIDPERALSITLLTNRTWPDRQSQRIKEIRPAFHDSVIEALGLT